MFSRSYSVLRTVPRESEKYTRTQHTYIHMRYVKINEIKNKIKGVSKRAGGRGEGVHDMKASL